MLSRHGLPDPLTVARELAGMQLRAVAVEARAVTAWDSGLVTFVMKLLGAMVAAGITPARDGLPEGVRRLIALAGCYRGMQSGRSAAAVGLAATSAVVTAIVVLIVLDGGFAVLLNALGL